MLIKSILTITTLFLASNALGGWISADDMPVGKRISIVDGVVFNWESKTKAWLVRETPVSIGKNPEYPHKYFSGGLGHFDNIDPTAFNLYLQEVFGVRPEATNSWSVYASYKALKLNFAISPITEFAFKSQWSSGSPIVMLAYDVNGKFRKSQTFNPSSPRVNRIYDQEFNVKFDFEVGAIKIGSMSDAAYIYAIKVNNNGQSCY